jgi:hypothetical protein
MDMNLMSLNILNESKYNNRIKKNHNHNSNDISNFNINFNNNNEYNCKENILEMKYVPILK